jgi:hypothetical protein
MGAKQLCKTSWTAYGVRIHIFEAAPVIQWSYQVMTTATTEVICRRVTRDGDRSCSPRPLVLGMLEWLWLQKSIASLRPHCR